jgi:hypothetical protein
VGTAGRRPRVNRRQFAIVLVTGGMTKRSQRSSNLGIKTKRESSQVLLNRPQSVRI